MASLVTENMQRFNYLSFEINSAYHDAALKMGLSDSAMLILYALCNDGEECLLRDITRFSGVSKQTIHSALRKLEAADIVTLDSSASRKKKVRLTEKGKKSVKHTVLRMIEIENEIFDSWSKQEAEQYLALTERYLTAFKKQVEEKL